MGSVAAGGIPSYALGGSIYRAAGPRVLCLITLGVYAFTLLLASSGFVRETFGGEKLAAAREERRERRRKARERSAERWLSAEGDSTRGPRRILRKGFEAIKAVFDPILRLRPTVGENGKRNLRLTILGIAYFFGALGTGYADSAIISYMTLVMHQDPAQVGSIFLFLTLLMIILK